MKINEFGSQKYFWKFIRDKFLTDLTLKSDWRVFVTSDMEAVELEAIEEFGQERVIRIPGINSHIDRETSLGNDCSRVEKPIMDFHFLQNCNKAIISQSGFGRLGLWNRGDPLRDIFVFSEKSTVISIKEDIKKHQEIITNNIIYAHIKSEMFFFISFFNLPLFALIVCLLINLTFFIKRKKVLKIKATLLIGLFVMFLFGKLFLKIEFL